MADDKLVESWFVLTRETMPALAREREWPVRFDHCFQRILLDNAVGAKWRDQIASPAYRNASDAQLKRAIALGEAAVADEEDLAELNRRSLAWRGKL
ncbi:Methylated-DNA--[protein]-cysteine S-methyltransferase [Alteripontixanthobacter maritimus]|uniref:Methylated-DNA--[protein]-cysteine S-methyltransferase n=1 Tax=Alteripontixanthobacter maritimus TaxID=2161824 RepID=A0A369Q6Y3_9SPHN|nr:GCN5-related N-acetyltransferase [Alteripontixanthobacter maritimus]RDC60242.1 Methylated-DNA--[protein]-cysteine S-methyltransferase [Alteripontixanthobacter maritimus]